MNDIKNLDKRYQTIAWGGIFLLLGILALIPGNQDAVFVLALGIIFLGLNLARYVSKIPVVPFSIIIGCLAFILGTVALLRPVLNIPPFDVPALPLVMIVLGLYILIPGPKQPVER